MELIICFLKSKFKKEIIIKKTDQKFDFKKWHIVIKKQKASAVCPLGNEKLSYNFTPSTICQVPSFINSLKNLLGLKKSVNTIRLRNCITMVVKTKEKIVRIPIRRLMKINIIPNK